MENFSAEELNLAAPVYSINSIDTYPLNPYRLLVYYIKTVSYNEIEHNNISLKDFYKNYSNTKRRELIDSAIAKLNLPNLNIEYVEKPEHEKIFLEFLIKKENTEIGHFIFYTHLSYISSFRYDTDEYVAAELDFSKYNCFEFLGIDPSNNIFDYSKDDKATPLFDMIIASIYAMYNFTEFTKYFKTKMLAVKNIQMFCDKLIKPIVTDMQLVFSPEHFMLGVLCGNTILKDSYSYDNYLQTVKEFEKSVRDKFGETYAKHDEDSSTSSS